MNLNLFEKREKDANSFIEKFIDELKKLENKNQNNMQESNTLDEYNLFEKKKIFLDNKSRRGNELAWVMDENSVCISENGDGGTYFISETDLTQDTKIGEVYEKVNGKYVYNDEITKELNNITNK